MSQWQGHDNFVGELKDLVLEYTKETGKIFNPYSNESIKELARFALDRDERMRKHAPTE